MDKKELTHENILVMNYDKSYEISPTNWESMIYSTSRKTEKLDGKWNFAIDIYDTGLRSKFFEEIIKDDNGKNIPVDFSLDDWEETKVPSNWNMEKPEYLYYEGSAWYTRKFVFYKTDDHEKVFIKIGAANYECRVWLNKKLIARHIGGSTPFYADVTDELKEENRILIMVNNTRKLEGIPSLNTDWFNYGGLYRSVELIRVPKTFVKDFFISLIPDGKFNKINVLVKTEGNSSEKCKIIIPELQIQKEFSIDSITGLGEIQIEASPTLWCPDNPKLYKVYITYGTDSIEDEIGFREIKTIGTKIFLNGEDIFLKGICIHEDSPINGKAVSESEVIENITLAKEMNCNYLRLAHYPHSEKVAKLADKLGIMLWEEIPVYWALQFTNKGTYNNAENQLSELIIRDRNRASVIIWSVGNENPDSDDRLEFMRNLAKRCKELDSTRLVSAACLVTVNKLKIEDRLIQYIDIIGINEYYGWYDRDFSKLVKLFENSNLNKPVIISETGGDALKEHHGTIDELFTEECQENIYKHQFRVTDRVEYIRGISPWIFFDFRTPRRMNKYQKGFNLKGLLSADKKYKKLAFYVVKDYYKNK